MSSSSIPFILGLIVTAGLLLPALLRLKTSVTEQARRAESLKRELHDLRRTNSQMEEEQRFLNNFLKDYPHVAKELYSGLKERQIPGALLDVVKKSLEPQQAVVFVRRGGKDGDSDKSRLAVAAATAEGGSIKLGTEIPGDTGALGYVAEAQIIMSRDELATEAVSTRIKPGPTLAGLPTDLVVPLVFDKETLGLIALSRPRRTSGDAKAALRLIAQTGAQALHNAAAYTRMKNTAEMDGLTRVFNKRHMEQQLFELIYRTACAAYDQRDTSAAQASDALSIFLFDIDNFKHYNDSNGHLAGDKLLQELSRLVQENIREDDIFGRFGGEEFLLILPRTNLAQSLAAANKVRGVIAAHKFPFSERQPLGSLSVSGGVAEYPYDGMDAVSLLKAADQGLYEAKRQGRNRIVAASGPEGAAGRETVAVAAPAPAEAVRS
jgi:diguanylate cyclase (GGDEF)-like protein